MFVERSFFMRAMWSGEIAFGLVTIPAKLYTATKDLTPQFHQLHTECGARISMARRCAKCNRDVEWGEIGKGYEVTKGEYALFTKDELVKIEGEEASGGIDIVEFIDPREVDLVYVGKSYWVGPGGKSARGFDLLRQALDQSGRVAVAKVRLRTRTQLGLLRPHGKIFALEVMRFADEIVDPKEIVVPEVKPATAREVELALNLVGQLEGAFDPQKHPDAYRAAVEAAVDRKVEAQETKRDESGEAVSGGGAGAQVIDLAELLARSLGAVPAPAPGKGGPVKARHVEAANEVEAKPGPKKASKAAQPKKRAASEK
jgi:DNA end-binding protein Ku